tara:strand:- start:561 stop:1226 length:666 start_codon:yes stop_codon:yes gene_type:complete
MARPRAETHEQQRDLIRDRAAIAFARLGYASASMADLAQACEVSKAALYHYFDSKEAILFEALDAYTRRLQELTLSYTNDGETDSLSTAQARDRLASLITALLTEYADSHSYHVSLLTDVKFLGASQREKITAQEREVVRRIGRLIDRAFPGRIEPARRSATTMALLGMINFTFAWWDPHGALDARQLGQLMIDLWWRGLSGPDESAPASAFTDLAEQQSG